MTAAEVANLAVRISLEDKLTGGIAKMQRSISKFDGSMGRAGAGAKRLTGGLLKVGAVAAAAVGAGLVLAAKSALEMDDAFASVRKNVEGTAPQLQVLNDKLHALATRIPVNYQDLAGIAAEAGALGVAQKDVVGFTETVARLSASTQGLSVEVAAEAFGKFKNSLQLTEKQIEQSASALIALGKAGASSEGDIIEIGKRFAGAGRTAGLSAAQVLGLASAISSVGVAPEAAGGSLSRLFNNINKYIGTGDKKLVAFAKTAGQTVAQFKKGFEKDALGSFEEFLKGLSKLSGPEQAKRLKEAGVNNVRDISALQLLAHSYKEVKRQTDLSTKAFKENTELASTSATRFDTVQNRLKVLANNFKEAAYDIGQGFLPALGRAADKLTAFLQDKDNVKFLKGIGEDLGKALDRVDFKKLLDAAKGLAKALDPALQIVLKLADLIAKLPPGVVGGAAGLIVADKIAGGAISGGIGDIIGGLGSSLAKSLAAKIPLFGSAFVQPVFVTNQGFGNLGNLATVVEGAVVGGLGATVLTVGLTAAAIAGLGLAFYSAMQQKPDYGPGVDANKTHPGFSYGHGFGPPGQHQRSDKPDPANHVFMDHVRGNAYAQGPTSRDGDKNLATASQILGALKKQGIDLQVIAGARLIGLGETVKSVKGNIQTLKDRLHSVIKQEGAATRAGDTRHANALAAKESAIRGQLSNANAKLAAIRAKKTSFTTHISVPVTTSVSVSAVAKATRTTSRVTKNGVFLVAG